MFTQDHGRDFDALLAQTEPLALVRFGDGEIALIDGNAHKSADAWKVGGPTWLRGDLVASLRYQAERWCIGLPTPCCLRSGIRIHPAVNAPGHLRTFSTLFLHSNLRRFGAVLERFKDAVIVGSWYGDVRIPEDGVSTPWDVDACVTELLKSKRDILLGAGPCANIIALRYWKRATDDERRFILDVGSALDVHYGKRSRHFHDTMADHRCCWDTFKIETGRPRRTIRPLVEAARPERIRQEPARGEFTERGRTRAEPMGKTSAKIGRRP